MKTCPRRRLLNSDSWLLTPSFAICSLAYEPQTAADLGKQVCATELPKLRYRNCSAVRLIGLR